jgi:hypothetical protein
VHLRKGEVMDNRLEASVFIPDYDGELFVEFTYYAGAPGKMYLNNGDPGYPDEPSEIEIESVSTTRGGPDLCSLLTAQAIEDIEEACALDAEDRREWNE